MSRREVHSYVRGTHMPRPRRDDERRCADCGRQLRPYTYDGKLGMRHVFARDHATEYQRRVAKQREGATMQRQEHDHAR